jgi:hypothetical protein
VEGSKSRTTRRLRASECWRPELSVVSSALNRLSEWTLSSLDPADFTITAQFSDGKISGSSGVNTYSGAVKLGPGEALSAGKPTLYDAGGNGSLVFETASKWLSSQAGRRCRTEGIERTTSRCEDATQT